MCLVLRHFNRLPFIGKCSLKWFAIWTLCFLTFMNSMIPYYRRFTIKPFTYRKFFLCYSGFKSGWQKVMKRWSKVTFYCSFNTKIWPPKKLKHSDQKTFYNLKKLIVSFFQIYTKTHQTFLVLLLWEKPSN